ncbi:chondroitin sulfate proteoglycan 4 [Drosophila rhopaloa]|uniref:Laminin G domain-containing protein n=1 Tax=Drosophila rhopaloa TaxID=1041015 RepID=A0ABM5HC18_DRORH|nr:chondroitin sulfate proteoglycan 4 [Drosophila rhopaloa]XP_016977931.2 chondroitin sulfate proteoglycan 4 [Drosophila rhopaloa]
MSRLRGLGWLWLALLAILQLQTVAAIKVSLFGDGYVSMPLQEAKMSTNIRVKFRTRQENALLFLAAGRTDYCLLRLESGMISFSYKIERDVVQLRSPKKQKLNDLEWHDVAVQRFENNITLQVDGFIMRKQLPGDLTALNIHFGTFLGGVGDFSAAFLDDVIGFRGCISDVFYNNINIIKRAKDRTSHTTSTGVSWTCSTEFDGTLQDSISFLKNDSYSLMLKESHAIGETLSLQFRTMASAGVIFFNGGFDFILLEIADQRLKVTFNKAGSLVQFMTNEHISDGKWHRVLLRYNAAIAELILDDATSGYRGAHANETKASINLEKSVFFGGVQEEMRRRLIGKGLRINEISFKGCMREIRVNDLPLGFAEMTISRSLALNCLWKYPCVEYNPCLKSGVCSQHGVDGFICYCDQSYCIKADFQGPFKIFTETSPELELLYVSPMQLLEGGTAFLSQHFIDITLDLRRYPSLNEQSIIFHVVHQPKYGQLLQYSPETDNFVPCRSFNLVDLVRDKLKYVHNGQENFNDHATLDMQVFGDVHKIPENILGKHRFLLHANITPINDPPQLKLHSHKILRVIEGIERVLDVDLFNIDDPDSEPGNLIYTILPTQNPRETFGCFMVGGVTTSTFSQADVNVGKVSYLYNSTTTESFSYQLQLQVSDGIETSDTDYLPVSVHPLELRLVNNTGLIMIHKSSLPLSPANLSIGTNAVDEHIDIRYDIVKAPQHGVLQRLRQIDGSWVNVDWFSDSQLLLGHIRYLHSSDFPWQDEFKFIASFGFVTTQTFDFRITFTRLRITSTRPSQISINGSREILLTSDILSYETAPIGSFPRSVIYKITKPTRYGGIYVEGSRKAAKQLDSFTQQDIEKRRIRYQTHHTSYSSFTDQLEFVVSVAECDDVMGTLEINYRPPEELINKLGYQSHEALQVQEGERALITKNHFEIRFNIFESLQFQVSTSPEHGVICKYDEQTGLTVPVEMFTLDQLFRNDIYYCHDDTESTRDTFELLILSGDDTDLQFVSNMEVNIKLVNDNEPYRTGIERVFHVVRNGIRTLNPAVLQYLDADVNTNHTDIHYIHVSSTNGAFYKSGHYVDSFTQDDIANRRIMFQHTGADSGTASFIVTDREYEVNGLLEISASDPFVSMMATNASIVQESKFVVLKNKDFILETNLDMKLDEIYYEIIKPPSYGILMYLSKANEGENGTTIYKATNYTSLSNFTHLDIERERLVYWNTEIASMDKVRYRVHIKNITAEGEVMFRIYPSAYWEPLQVKQNHTLYVEESTSVLISRDVLEVVHLNISPGDITFLVTSSPMHGYLEMQSMSFDDEYNCKVFDQSSVNTEKMFYIQAGVNQSTDYFVFDVTNGITWLRQLTMKIVIIPEKLYMHSNIISVVEGKTVQLNPTDIQPYSEYYRGKILEYIVTITPNSGHILAGSSKVKRFTQKQFEQGNIQYVHNGSENATDSITLVAMARNKESVPFELEFAVVPVNDEEPMIVTNTGLQVWNGGRYVIRNTDLLARDYDTPPENLTFIVNHIYGGFLARKSAPQHKIEQFTQAQINQEEIYFMQDSSSRRNELSFVVTDGLFNTTTQMLNIEIKPIEILAEHNENLHVFPLTKKQILRDHLHFKCSDEEREIRYNITVPPSLGRIVNEFIDNGFTKEVSEFTQNDVDNGHIFYEHTAVIMEFRINDSFYFDVVAERSDRLLDQKFNIEISVSSGGLLRFLPVNKLNVDEGGSVPIKLDFSKILEYLKTKAGINNPELFIEAVQKPAHGNIGLGHEFKHMQKYHPSDFFTKKVYYIHDHSDTLEDTILMSVYLTQGNIFLCNLTIPVSINPINDQPFHLITHLPQMTVVEGENRTITRNDLLTEDADTPPEEIVYDVMSGPTLGVLKKITNDGRTEDLLAFSNQFTQADINNDRIIYVHFGIPQSTTFCFTVSDGQFNAAYEIFTIKIAPISLQPSAIQIPVRVQQGANSAPMKLDQIGMSTNVQLERLSYNITNSPLFGIIVFKHQPTLRFTQHQLETSQISYMQTDLNRSNDSFQVSAYVPGTNYAAQVDVVMEVEPVIQINNIVMKEADSVGGKIKLITSLDNDNPLSLKLNKFNPKFVITRMPSTGQIRKIIRSTGLTTDGQNERSTNLFSYKELRSGVVYFVPHESVDETEADNDSFDYQLLIKTVQPAQATVSIEYRSRVEETETVHLGNAGLSINYLAIGCAIFIVLICLLIVLLILKIRKLRKHKADISKDQPPALPCPPDLTSVSPQHHLHHHHSHHYASSEADSVPATGNSTPLPGFSNIPHCKIIPVESYKHEFPDYDPDEEETDDQCDPQQMMLPQRYNPYHLEHDAWSSSCDMANDFAGYASVPQSISGSVSSPPSAPPTNPLLRRNQYWV